MIGWAEKVDCAASDGRVPETAARMAGEIHRLRAERQSVIDIVNLYGDETLHKALDDIGFAPRGPVA